MTYLLWGIGVLFLLWLVSSVCDEIAEWRWVSRLEREYRTNPEFRDYCDELDARIAARRTEDDERRAFRPPPIEDRPRWDMRWSGYWIDSDLSSPPMRAYFVQAEGLAHSSSWMRAVRYAAENHPRESGREKMKRWLAVNHWEIKAPYPSPHGVCAMAR
jgi:hypothetical protein